MAEQRTEQRTVQRSMSGSTIVTTAYQPRGEEIDDRRKQYVLMMLVRVVLIAISVLFLQGHVLLLVLATLASMVLPYVAVVLANGGRKKPEMGQVYEHEVSPMVAIGPGRTIDQE